MKKILITGSDGYTGRAIVQVLKEHFLVRGLDLRENPQCNENLVGSIEDENLCAQAVEGCDWVVQCHMAPRASRTEYMDYPSPSQPIDINVKGTANIYHAMMRQGINRCVMISTASVLNEGAEHPPEIGKGPYSWDPSLYAFSKMMQEMVARYYYDVHDIISTLLWPRWIVFDEELITKYGKKVDKYVPTLVDPRDIGRAVQLIIQNDPNKLAGYYIGQETGYGFSNDLNRDFGFELQYKFGSLPRLASSEIENHYKK